jgi:UDPglucose--hexose-1-phosphate uridylyltransferase
VGQEVGSPHELLTYRPEPKPGSPPWSLRVVPNPRPALVIEAGLEREGVGLYDRMSGTGAHELIIETPVHDRGWAQFEPAELEQVLWAWRDRMLDLRRDTRFRALQVFKHHGPYAGAPFDHSHSQILALPVVTAPMAQAMEVARRHHAQKERCLTCDAIVQERREDVRVVLETDLCLVLCPWASRSPFETWVIPKVHSSHYEELSRPTARAVAEALLQVVRRMEQALEAPSYQVLLHTAPVAERGLPFFHWRIEVVPVVAPLGALESHAGVFINPVPPEEAAAFLKKLEG